MVRQKEYTSFQVHISTNYPGIHAILNIIQIYITDYNKNVNYLQLHFSKDVTTFFIGCPIFVPLVSS